MKKSSRVISTLLLGSMITTAAPNVFAVEAKDVVTKKIAGDDRFQTAIQVSDKFEKVDSVVLVNWEGLADALAATPLAKMKNAPILFTKADKLTEPTAKQIEKLGAKTVYVIGGEKSVSEDVVKELEKSGKTVERIAGDDRYETSEAVAKKMGKVEKVAIVNGVNGIADALSVAAPAAKNDMAIILSNGKEINAGKEIVDNAKTKYVVGGKAVVDQDLVDELKAERLAGDNRNATNAEVIKEFYNNDAKFENVYVAKDGAANIMGLVDALAAGPLAGKEGAPVVLAGSSLEKTQKDTLEAIGKKQMVTTVTEVGGGINSSTVKSIVRALSVKDIEEPTEKYAPVVKTEKAVLKADGQSQTVVTFELRNGKGELIKDAKNVEVAFSTTFGKLADKRVTVSNGIATVLMTSETLDVAKTANIVATVVESDDKELIGIKAETNLLMDPNPDTSADQSVGASMTEVQAAQADRVIAYFNKNVNNKDYLSTIDEDGNVVNSTKLSATVSVNGKDINAYAFLPVEGNNNALQILLPKTNVLDDNSDVKVTFKDLTGKVPVETKQECKIADARIPAMLDVKVKGLNKLEVKFSEAVMDKAGNENSATNLKNWVIGGLNLGEAKNSDKFGTPKVTVGNFEYNNETKKCEDRRNVVTIELGAGKYLKAGDTSIQASNIGDWASLTDKTNNTISTQTLNFTIAEDTKAPIATVEVQSPEQYIVRFDKDVDFLGDLQKAIKLQKFNEATGKWEQEDKQTIKITPNPKADKTKNEFKVEVNKHWSDSSVYDTTNTTKNYYNDSYRLVVPKGRATAVANGISNTEIDMLLEGAMKHDDAKSPQIEISKYDAKEGLCKVTMNEPIKFDDKITAQFIKVTDKASEIETIDAKVEDIAEASDFYDKEFNVRPIDGKTLSAGEWRVVVRNVTDDIGNKSASTESRFTIAPEAEVVADGFKVLWAAADKNNGTVVVKFNKAIKESGKIENVLNTANYTINGVQLPKGSQIVADMNSTIANGGNIVIDDSADTVKDSITIKLADKNILTDSNILIISEKLQSSIGEELLNGGSITLNPLNPTVSKDQSVWAVARNTDGTIKTDVLKAQIEAEQEMAKLNATVEKLNKAVRAYENIKDDKDLAAEAAIAKQEVYDALAKATAAQTSSETKNAAYTGIVTALKDAQMKGYATIKFESDALVKQNKKYAEQLKQVDAKMPLGVTLGETKETTKGVVKVDGAKQVVELKITSKATNSGDLTIDGVNVAVLDADADAAAIATKIAAGSFTNWTAEVKAGATDTVVFTAKTAEADKPLSVDMKSTGVTSDPAKTTTPGKAGVAAKAEVATTKVEGNVEKTGQLTVNVNDGTINETVKVDVTKGQAATTVANSIKTELDKNAKITGKYNITVNGDEIVLTQVVGTEADVTVNVTLK